MVVRISDKTQNYSKVTKLLVKPTYFRFIEYAKKVFVKKHVRLNEHVF